MVTTEYARKGRGRFYISWHLQFKIMSFSGRQLNTTYTLTLAEILLLQKYQYIRDLKLTIGWCMFSVHFLNFQPSLFFNCRFGNNFLPLSEQNLVTFFLFM